MTSTVADAQQSDTPIYLQTFSAFKNKSLEQKVQELADREEIRELIARYAHHVANGYSVGDLFTEDGVYVQNIPGQGVKEVRSRQSIHQMYAHWTPGDGRTTPKPMIHNYLLNVSGDTASGLCSNEVRLTRNGESIIGSGYYEDKFRRDNGVWKFTYRNSIFFHMVPIQQGWAKPA